MQTGLPVFLISVVLLALQVALMQMLGYAQGHHLAYVVLSVALLGFGAGGSALTLWQARQSEGQPRPGLAGLEGLFTPALLLCAVFTALLPLPARPLLDGLEVDLLHAERGQWFRLVGLGAVFLPPFFFGACALSIAFATDSKHINRLYAANLFGSAAGSALALASLQLWQPEHLTTPLAVLALIAALVTRPKPLILVPTAAAILIAALAAPPLPRSPYKDLSYALQLPDAEREGPFPHALGRVDVVTAPGLRHAPDLSLRHTGPVPAPPHVHVDGDTAGVLLSPDDPAADILSQTPRALPYAATDPENALYLSPGGTPALLASTAATLTAVEAHPLLVARMKPLLDPERVTLHRGDPRLFLADATRPLRDLIVFPERGHFGGPGGLQTLGEDTLFTVESVRTALNRLSPRGRLAFNVWLDEPLRHAPRIVDLAATALRREGLTSPGEHILIVRGWGSMSVLTGLVPVSASEIEAVQTFCAEKGFDLIWPPSDLPRRHGEAGGELDELIAALLGTDPESVYGRYRFDVRAPTDNRPFFNQFLHPGDRSPDLDQLSVSERGPVFLRALLMLLAAGVAVLVFGPLIPLRKSLRHSGFTLLTFSGLGMGFMMFEVALMQRLTLLWGHPVISAAVVIATLLCGMGLGSAWSRKLPDQPRLLTTLLLAIALGMVLSVPLVNGMVNTLLGRTALVRFGVGGGLLLLLAIPLGMPFPLGIRILADRAPRQIPWACGIDSAVAVLTGPAAALLAFRGGFSNLFFLAAAAYFLAAFGLILLRNAPRA